MARFTIPYDKSPDAQAERAFREIEFQGEVVLRGDQVRILSQPIVYIWTRGKTTMYVGVSRRGLYRCFDPKHPLRDMEPTDKLSIYVAASAEEALRREAELIRSLNPVINKAGKLPPLLPLNSPGARCITEYHGKYFGRRRI